MTSVNHSSHWCCKNTLLYINIYYVDGDDDEIIIYDDDDLKKEKNQNYTALLNE